MLEGQRHQGRQVILSGIRRAGRIARVDLAQETGISAATVTTITAELIRAGLIEEVPREDDGKAMKRGRPRVDLKISGASHLVAGMKISSHAISTVVTDFEGKVIAEHAHEMSEVGFSPEELADHVEQALANVMGLAGKSVGALSGLGIGLAGIISAEEGLVYWSPSLKQRNVALREILADRTGLPVFLDNDANLVAKAEQYFGLGRGVSDFIVVTIESGVGMGIVLKNELYRGTRGCGAEFGHTKVQLDGALCRCGQRGCLEAYVADYALLREASIGTSFEGKSTSAQKLQSLIRSAKAGDHTAQTIISRAGRMFAMGLANIVNIFDPKLIILAGERMQFDYLYAEEVIDSIRDSIVQVDVAPPEVVIHKWSDLMWATGAAAYAIESVSEIALRTLGENAA